MNTKPALRTTNGRLYLGMQGWEIKNTHVTPKRLRGFHWRQYSYR